MTPQQEAAVRSLRTTQQAYSQQLNFKATLLRQLLNYTLVQLQ